MRRLTPSDYRTMPWRNGGGTTTEIVIAPRGAALGGERFLYRVSIADVASDGPFSRFEGYDRHIMLLAGAGMTLDAGAHGTFELRVPFEPYAFSGDWEVRGTLVAGASRDFNLIVDRARASASLEVHRLEEHVTIACEPSTTCIMHVLEGELEAGAGELFVAGESLVASAPFELAPRGAARVALARVVPTPP